MRTACEILTAPTASSGHAADNDTALLAAVAGAVNLLYNASGSEMCYESLPARDDELDGIWDYQWCTQLMCQETYFSRRGVDEGGVFPAFEFNQTWVDTHCLKKYGVTPAHRWISSSYGGWDAITGNGVSNIVFSNGEYDPWRAAGVYGFNATERDVVSLLVQQGAHHLDLMFSTEDDPQSVRDVRAVELSYISKWEAQAAVPGGETGGGRGRG